MTEVLNPYEDINFIKKRATITNSEGEIIFDEEVIFPDFFNDNDINIVASKYLCNNAKKKENSLTQMIDRVSNEISEWGWKDKYFKDEKEKDYFNYKLKYYQINQYFAFNSPVYFNIGLNEKPQGSACFILKLEDSMDSITEIGKIEGRIFKQGSGSGINYSSLRSSFESVEGGGKASGPVSFLKSHDTNAAVIKSGGTLRRSAKMACLNISHPDIEKFISCKEKEEEKLKILRENNIKPEKGYDLSDEVFFQNTNISVRITDQFMNAVEDDEDWWTTFVTDGRRHQKYKARKLLQTISKLAWKTADPGILFHDTTNKMNTCKLDGEINSCNPCAEFVFLDNSSCNLASLNLLKFFYKDNNDEFHFNYDKFYDVIKVVLMAQDIIVDNCYYPTEEITNNSRKYRPLGLGYSNLGATLMFLGFPYDSEEGRLIAANITSILTGCAYNTSNKIAERKGSFERFEDNKISFYEVLNYHMEANSEITELDDNDTNILIELKTKSHEIWEKIYNLVLENKTFRNAQVTLLAPTGTISSLMGCATTGIEPEFSLVKFKRLSGSEGATIKYTNTILKEALQNLICSNREVNECIEQIIKDGHLDNIEVLDDNEKRIFDTAISPGKGVIDYMGHLKMVAAVQPFLSGSISKTINLPSHITEQEIYNLYLTSWRMGLKGVTVYRDGCKNFQPLSISKDNKIDPKVCVTNVRNKLPYDRNARIHKFTIGTVKGYIISGHYEDGKLGEIFVNISKQGSTLSGLMDSLATLVSMSLQYGVPLKDIVKKLMYQKFDPSGFTSNKQIRTASSLVDYIFRYLGFNYLKNEELIELGLIKPKEESIQNNNELITNNGNNFSKTSTSTNPCPHCGALMRRLGSCEFCDNCHFNGGACG